MNKLLDKCKMEMILITFLPINNNSNNKTIDCNNKDHNNKDKKLK